MSALTTAPCSAPSSDRQAAPAAPTAVEFHYAQTDSFVALLQQLGVSLLVTTYQANKLLVVRAVAGGLSTLVRHFDKPMGLAVDSRRLALGTLNQVWFLRNAPDIAPRIEPAGAHDACYLPRSCHVTGDIAVHEMAWVGEELWIVNTRFSCLCTLGPDYSFFPRWRPPFITALAAEDRCHLNGLAVGQDSNPATAQGGSESYISRWSQRSATLSRVIWSSGLPRRSRSSSTCWISGARYGRSLAIGPPPGCVVPCR